MICLIFSTGVGPYRSGAAAHDLMAELTAIHGEPYAGRRVENGWETMAFSIEPGTFFFTDYNLRKFFGWDYRYTCTVTRTVSSQGEIVSETVIHYTGIDPMGFDEQEVRAYLDRSHAKGQSSMP